MTGVSVGVCSLMLSFFIISSISSGARAVTAGGGARTWGLGIGHGGVGVGAILEGVQ